MKKILNITALVLCVAVVIGMGVSSLADASVNQVSPNRYKITRNGRMVDGFIQIQPSYNENGQHAQVGTLCIWSSYSSGRSTAQTPVGTHEGDSRLLDDICVLRLNLLPQGKENIPVDISMDLDIKWQPHTGDPTRPWANPFSFSPIENLIEPQLMK